MKIYKCITIGIIAVSFLSCSDEIIETIPSTNEADMIISQLSDSVTLGGVIFPSVEEYNSYPKLKIEDMPVLNSQYVENRSGYKILKTPKVVNQGKEGACLPFTMGYIGVSYLLYSTKGMPYEEIGMIHKTLS